MHEFFRKFAGKTSEIVGSTWSFLTALVIIIVWAVTGPMFHYSDTWQLVINTGTTIITFLMVFLIQNTQNRDAKGIHLKLDELIKATTGAQNRMMDLDKLSDKQLEQLEAEYKRICGLEDDENGGGAGRNAVEEELEKRAQ
jgi:low affinity Fe/Cu permease